MKSVQEALSDALEQRLNLVNDQFDQIDADADARIKRWRYAKDSAFELRAEYYRRFNANPGRLVDDEPLDAFIYTAYGYDNQDRIICSAVFQSEDFPRIYTYYQYAENHIDFAEFGIVWDTQTYQLSKVGRLIQSADDRPLYYADYSQGNGRKHLYFEEYHYDEAGRVAQISCVHQGGPAPLTDEEKQRFEAYRKQQEQMFHMFPDEEQAKASMESYLASIDGSLHTEPSDMLTEEVFEYEGQTLKRIVARELTTKESPPPPDYVMYEMPRPGETPDMLFDEAHISLKEAILRRLEVLDTAARKKGPFYNLILSYDAVADDGLMLTLNTHAQRKRWEQSTSERRYDSLQFDSMTQPQDAMVYVEIHNLPDGYARFLRENRRDEQWERIRELLCAVSRELNNVDWSERFKITDDFIVFASDYEAMDDIQDEIRACVSESKLALLQARGLID